MLQEAKIAANINKYSSSIKFEKMDALALDFPDEKVHIS
jgi:hypothetical protein